MSGKLNQIKPQSLKAARTHIAMNVGADGRVTQETPTTWRENTSGSLIMAVGADGHVAEEKAAPIDENFSGHLPRLESRSISAALSDGLTTDKTAKQTDDNASGSLLRPKLHSFHAAREHMTMVDVAGGLAVEDAATTTNDEKMIESMIRLQPRFPHTNRRRANMAAGANGLRIEEAETQFVGVSASTWRTTHYDHAFPFDARGSVRKQGQTNMLLPEQWRLESDVNRFVSHSLLGGVATSQDLWLFQWSYVLYAVPIGLVSLVLLLLLLLCCSDTFVIWLGGLRFNRNARLALLEHRKGDQRSSWQLFRSYAINGPMMPPYRQAVEMLDSAHTMHRIGMVFDALKAGGQYVTKNDIKRLCGALEAEITFGDTNEKMTWLSASEDDHNWLFECWDEAFSNQTHLDRSSFSDLLKLLVAWRMGRSKGFHIFTRGLRLLDFPKKYMHIRNERTVVRINLGAPIDPIVIIDRELSESTKSERGSLTFRHEVEEREFLAERSSRGVSYSSGEFSSRTSERTH